MIKKQTQRKIKFLLLLVVMVAASVYSLYKWDFHREMEDPPPQIRFKEEILLVSVNVTQEELLAGVSAVDETEGDVSGTLIVESMSNLLEDGQRIVTYAAFDSNHHVGKGQRRIQYTDYVPLRFSLEAPLDRSGMKELSDLLAPLKVWDCIDGNISDRIVVVNVRTLDTSPEWKTVGYLVQVTNSCGQVAELDIPVRVKKNSDDWQNRLGVITLSEYLVYCQRGDYLLLRDFVEKIDLDEEEAYELDISTDLDTSVPGVYLVTYTVVWGEDDYASCDLVVVVEE